MPTACYGPAPLEPLSLGISPHLCPVKFNMAVDWTSAQEVSKDLSQLIHALLATYPSHLSIYLWISCISPTCFHPLRIVYLGGPNDLGLWMVIIDRTPHLPMASSEPSSTDVLWITGLIFWFKSIEYESFILHEHQLFDPPPAFFFLCRYCMLIAFLGLYVYFGHRFGIMMPWALTRLYNRIISFSITTEVSLFFII